MGGDPKLVEVGTASRIIGLNAIIERERQRFVLVEQEAEPIEKSPHGANRKARRAQAAEARRAAKRFRKWLRQFDGWRDAGTYPVARG